MSETPILVIEQVALEVKEWSLQNFGDQKGLNHIAPAMGLMEELGELEDSIIIENHTLIEDSVGDIGIYSLDLIGRLEIPLLKVWPEDSATTTPRIHRTVAAGRIMHCVLKNHQGIRGFKDQQFFLHSISEALKIFLDNLNRQWDVTALTIQTWNEVKDRNWKKNAEKGTA